ncbi:MAG: MotE family protein [Alphaproteobacteria bacterium]
MTFKWKILPALIVVALLTFSVRMVEVVSGFTTLNSPAALAEEEKNPAAAKPAREEPKKEEAAAKEAPAKASDAGKKDGAAPAGERKAAAAKPAEETKWPDAGDAEMDMSATKMEMVKDLVNRRGALDKRESELIAREALLKAAEKEIDQKYKELSALRVDIEELLKQQSDAEKERTTSLVKVYEGMKPKDAARIFDTLDLDILISVVSGMSPKKLSPILAQMNEERARTVTIMLAEEKKLPTLPLAN